ncbi:MAG: S8/S53 family peptidase [Myxococcota bacterium]
MRAFGCLLFGFGMISVGCGVAEGDLGVTSDTRMAESLVFEEEPEVAAAGTAWRWIGTLPDGESNCPEPDDDEFETRPLFAAKASKDDDLPDALSRYCVYESDNFELGVDGVPEELAKLDLEDLEADLAVVAGNASLADIFAPMEADTFDQQVARLPRLPGESFGPVELALIDSAPSHPPVEDVIVPSGASGHGFALAQMMRRVLCDDEERCVGMLGSELALSLNRDPNGKILKQPDQGGAFGTIGELAEAIRSYTRQWKERDSGAPLVLNLSLGWNPLYGGDLEDKYWTPSVRSVYDALAEARCRGALIFAASGNATGGQAYTDGPLLPAAWNLAPAPSAEDCLERYQVYSQQEKEKSEFGSPLVYAVAGVGADGTPIANARPNAQSRIVGYAQHATASFQGSYSRTLTGTSVGSAIASAVATLVWSYNPWLSADHVAHLVYASGDDIGRTADYCPGAASGCSEISRRISACQALFMACERFNPSCHAELEGCESALGVKPEAPPNALKSFAAPLVPAPVFSSAPVRLSECGSRDIYEVAGHLPTDPCPDVQFYDVGVQPWTNPQPGIPPCPNCKGIRTLSSVVLDATVELDPGSVSTLHVTRGRTEASYDLSSASWPTRSSRATVQLSPGFLSGATSARLSMTVDGRRRTIPLPLVE